MEFTREIYWNVGGSALTLVPMYLLSFLAIGIMAWGFWRRIKVYRQGGELTRTDNLRERIISLLKNMLLQTRVMRVRGAGTAHGLFFWGFAILFIGTCLILLQADITDPIFGIQFLKGNFYKVFSLSLDIAGLVAMLMLLGLLVRRYLVRPRGLETSWENAFMHGLLLLILFSGFVLEGARMAVTELGTPLAIWSPVGLVFAHGLKGLGESTLLNLHLYLWWVHFALALLFIVSIPFTKLRHLFTTPANSLLAYRGPMGKMSTLNLEDESAERFGAATVKDLTWKDIFDADACTQCKRCQDRCPAHVTDKPLSPMKVVNQVGEVAFAGGEANLIDTVSRDALWSCTTCRACEDICPASIEHLRKILDMRRNLVLMEGEFPGEEVMAAMENTEVNGNPLGMPFAARGDWAQDLGIRTLAEDADVDVLFFVGCYASFDKRNQNVARSFVKLCQQAGVRVGILGKEEKCCGEPMRKLGNEYLYQTLAAENIALMEGYGVKKIVSTCPHCFNTLAKDYQDLGLNVEVEHSTVFLQKLLEAGRLKLSSRDFECTYHDSCYLSRHNEILDPPRQLLKAAGARIVEMERCGMENFCCGAGGGRILAEENLGSRISQHRVEMASQTGAPVLISNCPFCLTMFEDGVKGAELEGDLKPLDIAEILAERL